MLIGFKLMVSNLWVGVPTSILDHPPEVTIECLLCVWNLYSTAILISITSIDPIVENVTILQRIYN
jgi:hypothetical protein